MGCEAAPIGNIRHTARAGFATAARQIADESAPTPSAEADRAAICYLLSAICYLLSAICYLFLAAGL
jgi:hypothetical protein